MSAKARGRGRRLARTPRIFVLNGFEAGAEVARLRARRPGAGDRQRGGVFALGREPALRAACRHRDEPAWASRSPSSSGSRDARPALLMSHFVSAEVPDDPVNAQQIAAFARARTLFPRRQSLARQFLGNIPAAAPALRSRPAGLCALRRQSDAGRGEPDAPRRDAGDRGAADALDRGGRDLRLQRPLDRQAPHAACDPARRLRRRPALSAGSQRRRARRRSEDRRPDVPAGRAALDGPRHRRRHLSCRKTPSGQERLRISSEPKRRSTNSPRKRGRSATPCSPALEAATRGLCGAAKRKSERASRPVSRVL